MTTFARLRDAFKTDREPERALFCTYGFDAGFFEAEILPALLPQTLRLDRESGAKRAYQNAADAGLTSKGIAVFFDHISGEGPELIYETWRVDVSQRAFHPKLTVLDYGDHLRAVVSSANVSRAAWSTLLEIFVVEDLVYGQPHAWASDLRGFLERLAGYVPNVETQVANVAAELARLVAQVPDGPGSSRLASSWDGPIADALLDGITNARTIDVVTPFFEGEGGPGMFDRLSRHLGAKAKARIWTTVERIDGRDVVRGPEEKLRALLDSKTWSLSSVNSTWDGDEEDAPLRALHGKLIAVEHGGSIRVLVGSPNATQAALLSRAPQGNVELGVLTEIPSRALAGLLPQGTPVAAANLTFVNDGDPTGEDAAGQAGPEQWVLAATYVAADRVLTLAVKTAAPSLTVRYGDRELGVINGIETWVADLNMGAERYVTVDDGTARGVVPFVVLDPERLEPRWTAREVSFEDFCDVLAGHRETSTSDSDAQDGHTAGFGAAGPADDIAVRGPIPWRRYLAALRGLGHELSRQVVSPRGMAFVLENPARLRGLLERLDRARQVGRFTAADHAYALYELERVIGRVAASPALDPACGGALERALEDLACRSAVAAEGTSDRLREQLALLRRSDAA